MPVRQFVKTYSQANAVASGASVVLFGPIPVDHLSSLNFTVKNTSTLPIVIQVRQSSDKDRNFETPIHTANLTNTDFTVSSSQLSAYTVVSVNSFRYITILASATAAVSSNLCTLSVQGKIAF